MIRPPAAGRLLIFFAGVALVYAAFSPLSLDGMGYAGEELEACNQLVDGRPVVWPRNGVGTLLVQCPFEWANRLVPARFAGLISIAALLPILATAGLVTLLFAAILGLTRSHRLAWAMSLAAAFGTLLWPYAYIGLETSQSLFLFLTGYLVLCRTPSGRAGEALLVGLSAGLAVSVKSGGFLLVPAVAYALWRYLRGPALRNNALLGTTTALVPVLLFALNWYVRELSWSKFGGTAAFARGWLVKDPVSPLLHLAALLSSPNKGLIVYAPLALLGLLALPAAWTEERPVAAFAFLVLAGVAGGLSLLQMWSDETWGPRYLHPCIAPLVLCLALGVRRVTRRRGVRVTLAAATVLGGAVSLLGVLFYYGSLHGVAAATRPITLEALQGDLTWNHVRFNSRLLEIWLRRRSGGPQSPELLPRPRVWDFRAPAAPLGWNDVDLRPLAHPQPAILRAAAAEAPRRARIVGAACLAFLCAGVALIAALRRAPDPPPS